MITKPLFVETFFFYIIPKLYWQRTYLNGFHWEVTGAGAVLVGTSFLRLIALRIFFNMVFSRYLYLFFQLPYI